MPLTREKLRPRECKAKLAKSAVTQLRKGTRELENQFEYIKELRIELEGLKANAKGGEGAGGGGGGDRESKGLNKELKEGRGEVERLKELILNETSQKDRITLLLDQEKDKLEAVKSSIQGGEGGDTNFYSEEVKILIQSSTVEYDKLSELVLRSNNRFDTLTDSSRLVEQELNFLKETNQLLDLEILELNNKKSNLNQKITLLSTQNKSSNSKDLELTKLEIESIKELKEIDLNGIFELESINLEDLNLLIKSENEKIKLIVNQVETKRLATGMETASTLRSKKNQIVKLQLAIKTSTISNDSLVESISIQNKDILALKDIIETRNTLEETIKKLTLDLCLKKGTQGTLIIESKELELENQLLEKDLDEQLLQENNNIKTERTKLQSENSEINSRITNLYNDIEDQTKNQFKLVDKEFLISNKLDLKIRQQSSIIQIQHQKEIEEKKNQVLRLEFDEIQIQSSKDSSKILELESKLNSIKLRLDSKQQVKTLKSSTSISSIYSSPPPPSYSKLTTTTNNYNYNPKVIKQLSHNINELNLELNRLRKENLDYSMRLFGF